MPCYFITWTTYGTWLHGDDRGSIERSPERRPRPVRPDPERLRAARSAMIEPPFVMAETERGVTDDAVKAECAFRGWRLLALNVRTNHVHVVLQANEPPEEVMRKLKATASRQLRDRGVSRKNMWTRHGSTRWIKSDDSLSAAIHYVMHEQ